MCVARAIKNSEPQRQAECQLRLVTRPEKRFGRHDQEDKLQFWRDALALEGLLEEVCRNHYMRLLQHVGLVFA
jgi:hypothetical protein